MFDADDDGVTVGELEAEHAGGTAARVRARGGGDGRGGGATERTGDVRGAHELEDHGADKLAAARAVVLARPRGETPQPHPRQVDVQERSPRGGRVRAFAEVRQRRGIERPTLGGQERGERLLADPHRSRRGETPVSTPGTPRGRMCQVTPNENSRKGSFRVRGRWLVSIEGKDVDVAHTTRTPTGRERGSAQSTTSTTPRR